MVCSSIFSGSSVKYIMIQYIKLTHVGNRLGAEVRCGLCGPYLCVSTNYLWSTHPNLMKMELDSSNGKNAQVMVSETCFKVRKFPHPLAPLPSQVLYYTTPATGGTTNSV